MLGKIWIEHLSYAVTVFLLRELLTLELVYLGVIGKTTTFLPCLILTLIPKGIKEKSLTKNTGMGGCICTFDAAKVTNNVEVSNIAVWAVFIV